MCQARASLPAEALQGLQQWIAERHSQCVDLCDAGSTVAFLPVGALDGAPQSLSPLLKPVWDLKWRWRDCSLPACKFIWMELCADIADCCSRFEHLVLRARLQPTSLQELWMELCGASATCYSQCGRVRNSLLMRADLADALIARGLHARAAVVIERQCRLILKEGWKALAALVLPRLLKCEQMLSEVGSTPGTCCTLLHTSHWAVLLPKHLSASSGCPS